MLFFPGRQLGYSSPFSRVFCGTAANGLLTSWLARRTSAWVSKHLSAATGNINGNHGVRGLTNCLHLEKPPPAPAAVFLLVLMQLIILSFPRQNAEGLWNRWFEVPDHVNRLLNVSLGRLSSKSWALVSVCAFTQGVEGKLTHLLFFWVQFFRAAHVKQLVPVGFGRQQPHQLLKNKQTKKTPPEIFSWTFVPCSVARRSHSDDTGKHCRLQAVMSLPHPQPVGPRQQVSVTR